LIQQPPTASREQIKRSSDAAIKKHRRQCAMEANAI